MAKEADNVRASSTCIVEGPKTPQPLCCPLPTDGSPPPVRILFCMKITKNHDEILGNLLQNIYENFLASPKSPYFATFLF